MNCPDFMAHRFYTIHGMGVRIRWDDAAVGQRLQTICDYFGLVSSQAALPQCQFTLDFVTTQQPPSVPAGACAVAQHHGITAWQAGKQMYLSDPTCLMQLVPASGTGMGTIHVSSRDTRHAVRKDLVIYSLLCLLRYRAFYAVHAACVAHHDVGCLFVADCDSGKSTMALSLVRQGWGYLSDDSILLRPHADYVEALALRRDVCLDPEAARYFPDVVAHWHPCPLADEVKQRLNLEALYPEQMMRHCVPRLLIFPHIVAAPQSQLVPVGKADALLRLIRQSALVVLEPHMAQPHLDVLKRVVNQTRHYQLAAGKDLARNPALIADLLSDVVCAHSIAAQKEQRHGTSCR